MLRFIFASDWRSLALILSVVSILFFIFSKSWKDYDRAEIIWIIFIYIVSILIIPIATPVLLIIFSIIYLDFPELPKWFSDIIKYNKESKSSNKKTSTNIDLKSKKEMIADGLDKIVQILKDKEAISQSGYHNGYSVSFKYIPDVSYSSFSNRGVKRIIDGLEALVVKTYNYAENPDYVKIANKMYDISVGSVEFYSSVISDEFMSIEKMEELIRGFHTQALSIVNQLIEDETVKVRDRKDREQREEKERIEILAKVSYDKFNSTKDNMINTLNTIANIKSNDIKREDN